MTKYSIIGNMTGNSMDAIDLVLTEFDGDKMTDICSYSKPYSRAMQNQIENLRRQTYNKTRTEIENLPDFQQTHDGYVREIADCINLMCAQNNLDKNQIDAIGFHGKTLDHNPPSKARMESSLPYTLQIGSGQMLADLTGIKVVYDFRSAPIMAGFEGAPLAPPHNAHISVTEGDGIYYNGGNTSNFAVIANGRAIIGADAGPCNEYTDNFIRQQINEPFDRDGRHGQQGRVDNTLLAALYSFGQNYYQSPLPKSGDPSYYHQDKIFDYVRQQQISFNDAVRTFEYFAAYIAVQALTLIPENISLPPQIILFGGGWNNPIVKQSFTDFLSGKGYVLPQHQTAFASLSQRFSKQPNIRPSQFQNYMEARLFADLARYRLQNKSWEIPEIIAAGKEVVCGVIATPQHDRCHYSDRINLAAKGWQQE